MKLLEIVVVMFMSLCLCMIQFDVLPCPPPPPRAYPRGFAHFFLLGGQFPRPRALRKSRYFCVSFLWSRNAKFKNIPKQAHLPKAIKIQPVSNILQKKMEPKRCYACADLLFIASLHERSAYERERC